jgi:hypothetical protein
MIYFLQKYEQLFLTFIHEHINNLWNVINMCEILLLIYNITHCRQMAETAFFKLCFYLLPPTH